MLTMGIQMKAQSKNRKHPTCNRCRSHGKKDIRVLQHQCPFKNCPCSSCQLIKRRSIIYRAQKNLDKHDDSSEDHPSSPTGVGQMSADVSGLHLGMAISQNGDNKALTNMPSPHVWNMVANALPNGGGYGAAYSKTELPKIADFQSLCLTFPDYSPSHLQSLFEQCGCDFQKTIDRILMTKWCGSDVDSKSGSLLVPSGSENETFPNSQTITADCYSTGLVAGEAYNTPYCDWGGNGLQRIVPSSECYDQAYLREQQQHGYSQRNQFAAGGNSATTPAYQFQTAGTYTGQNVQETWQSANQYGYCEANNWANSYNVTDVYDEHYDNPAPENGYQSNGCRSTINNYDAQNSLIPGYEVANGQQICGGSSTSSGSEFESSQQSVNSYSSSVSEDAQECFKV